MRGLPQHCGVAVTFMMPVINRRCGLRAGTFVFVMFACLIQPTNALALPIDNIRLSRIAPVTTTEIELGCAMRYLHHAPASSGTELRVRMALGIDCVNALRTTPNSIHRPPGSRLANLTSVEFNKVAADQAVITLRFETPVRFAVSQTSNEYLLTVTIDGSEALTITTTAAPPPNIATPGAPPAARTLHNQAPSRPVRSVVPQLRDLYAVRLSELTSADDIDRGALDKFASKLVYVNKVVLDDREWNDLRLGFFESEAQALAVRNEIRHEFPDAWISIATPDEQAMAETQILPVGKDGVQENAMSLPARTLPATVQPETLPDERVTALMSEAKSAIVRGDFDKSIRIYTRLLQQPEGSNRRMAREFLGVALQKNGQPALARAEFELYLTEFPDGADAARVTQRLAALSGATPQPSAQVAAQQSPGQASQWQYDGALSQFYMRGVSLARGGAAEDLSQSGLLSQGIFSASRRGDRFDLLVRGNVGYLHDLSDSGSRSQGRASYLYVDVNDNQLDLAARLGRQAQHSAGVPGHFDGMHFSYALRRDLSVNVTAGFPIDSPRFRADPNHYFYGASAEWSNVLEMLDFSVFTQQQSIDGIADRQAIGADVQYHSNRFNLFGLVDYDTSYEVVNNAMLVGNWRLNDRLSLNGRYQGGAAPFLTTRNAIIGQPVNTVEALLADYTEGQVRRLARNRTAQVRSGAAGLSASLSPRWHLNADIDYSEYGPTISSGGVSGFRGTGPQYTYSAQLLASSWFKAGDTVVFGLRHRQSRDVDANTAIFEIRLPVGEGLRINPRLAVTLEDRTQNAAGATEQWIINPMLRLFYSWRGKYRVEFEAGGHRSDLELPNALPAQPGSNGSIERSGYYLQLGYWMDFR